VDTAVAPHRSLRRRIFDAAKTIAVRSNQLETSADQAEKPVTDTAQRTRRVPSGLALGVSTLDPRGPGPGPPLSRAHCMAGLSDQPRRSRRDKTVVCWQSPVFHLLPTTLSNSTPGRDHGIVNPSRWLLTAAALIEVTVSRLGPLIFRPLVDRVGKLTPRGPGRRRRPGLSGLTPHFKPRRRLGGPPVASPN